MRMAHSHKTYLAFIILKSHFDTLFIQYHRLPITHAGKQNISKCVKLSTVTPLQTLISYEYFLFAVSSVFLCFFASI